MMLASRGLNLTEDKSPGRPPTSIRPVVQKAGNCPDA